MEPDPLRPPSVFTARWFRLLLVLLFLLLVAIVGLPYILDWIAPVSQGPPVALKPAPPSQPAPTQPAQAPGITQAQEPPAAPTPAPIAEEKKAEPALPPRKAAAPPPPPPAAKSAPPQKAAVEKARYAVQVGAFTDAANAVRLTKLLKEEKFSVQQLTVVRSTEGFQVIASGSAADAAKEKVARVGTEWAQSGATFTTVRPMPLKDAVSLSERLKSEGLDVKIKTIRQSARYHVVRVGGFPDVKSAEGARRELQEKGITGLVVPASAR